MEPVINAAFSLEDYKITRFLLNHPDSEPDGLDIMFDPSGTYDQPSGVFHLRFDFAAFYSTNEVSERTNICEATMVSEFKFNEPLEFEDLPDFFYINSIAIVFPHLRAFISTVTSLSNTRRIILPILNLTSLEATLKAQTVNLNRKNENTTRIFSE